MSRIKTITTVLVVVVAIFMVALAAMPVENAEGQLEQPTNLNGLHLSNTSFGTATPALMVNNGGTGKAFEVLDSATPVFSVLDGGSVTGDVLRYATAGEEIVCGTDTITGTANVSHGLTTPTYAVCVLAADPTGDAQTCSHAISGSTVTVKVWQSNATPTANSTGHSIDWCVIGTP